MKPHALILTAALTLFSASTPADEFALNPQVKKVVDDVSEEHIKAIIQHLVTFGTRNTMSNPDTPDHGVGAARQWILSEMKTYSPRLQVRFDKWHIKKNGQRIFKDIDLYNVVAILPGKTMPETQVIVSGHYDSLNLGAQRPGAAAGPASDAPPAAIGERPTQSNWEVNAELPAPGACDDGSGTAATMELARVMSQYEFDKTLVFIAFAGEEQGLVGSTLEATKAKEDKVEIEAVLNNDIIGTDISGNGRSDSSSVSIYSDTVMDSPSQNLARYAKLMGERYMPSMKVNIEFMQDRLGRGGDHTPFQLEGYAAVRLSTPNEIYANQHRATDTFENMSVPYTTRVAKINAAVMASLGLSPRAPAVMRLPGAPAQQAPATGRNPLPMVTRGSGYDAVLQWRPAGNETAIKGYTILMRPTTAPFWEREIYVGKATTYTFKDVSVDDVRFGVKAIGADGAESLVSPYAYPPRQKATYDATYFQ
jgi:Peptidase family M28